jgi:hypothetical protein
MKKLFLLLSMCIIALNVVAQFSQPQAIALHNYLQQKNAAFAKKTTAAPPRWYNYGNAMDTSANAYYGSYNQNTAICATTIWNDTNGKWIDSTHTYRHLTNVCEGAAFDPKANVFNYDPDEAYLGQMYITDTDAYELDSIEIFGTYLYNSAKSTEVDTLRLVFMTGKGGLRASDNLFRDTLLPGTHYGTDSFFTMQYDSVKNIGTGNNPAKLYPTTTPHYMDILLDNTNRNDTLPGGIWHQAIAVNGSTGISVDSANICAVTITYISGDAATKTGILSAPIPGDTLVGTWLGWGNSKYNVWCPLVAYYATYSGIRPTAAFPPYPGPVYLPNREDNNLGYWKRLPNYANGWENIFPPTWNQVTGSGASVLQYPYISWYVNSCPTCGIVMRSTLGLASKVITLNTVKAYPDPAKEEVKITFDFSGAAHVTVSLTNMMGQEVAAKTVNNAAAGNVVFNTAMLPDGVYIYTLLVNGTVTTGRVAVAH